jgi:hypothetical protein
VPETSSETSPEPEKASDTVAPIDADKVGRHARRATTARSTRDRRAPVPSESFEAEPSRNERLLFMISVGLLVLLAIALAAWSIR